MTQHVEIETKHHTSRPFHWTYRHIDDATSDLQQGDILYPSEELRQVFREVHPFFQDAKYLAFMVITQSCDLVRRKRSTCRAKHIEICVVRDLATVLPRLLEDACGTPIKRVFRHECRRQFDELLERITNQNEQSYGLFYLHPDAEAQVSVASVAMLRISIALRADHYDRVVKARTGRLTGEFQAKLGWLIGNLYSRVGTTDWSEEGHETYHAELLTGLKEQFARTIWASEDAVRALQAGAPQLDTLDEDELRASVAAKEPKPTEQALTDALRLELDRFRDVRFDDELANQMRSISEIISGMQPEALSTLVVQELATASATLRRTHKDDAVIEKLQSLQSSVELLEPVERRSTIREAFEDLIRRLRSTRIDRDVASKLVNRFRQNNTVSQIVRRADRLLIPTTSP